MAVQCSFFFLFFIYFFCLMSLTDAGSRKLTTKFFICPKSDCPNTQNDTGIVWIKAEAQNKSTIHYLWTRYPVPTIVVACTTVENVELKISWKKLMSKTTRHLGLYFHPPVNYTLGFAIPIIYEFDDADDKVDLNDNSQVIVHKFTEYTKWKMESTLQDKPGGQVKFIANDSIIFEFIASTSEDRETKLPYQKYTEDSNRFSLTLDNMKVVTNNTRFAAEVNYVVQKGNVPRVATKKTFDDEYTPAVFETVYGKVSSGNESAYSQWKPIAYTNPELGSKYQTKASASKLERPVNRSWNIAEVVMSGGFEIYGLNVSFGLTKDGFYQKYQYLTWRGIVGYGKPAVSSMSFLVILIISIGLGLPLAIILFGGTYMQIRKRCRKSKLDTYGQIN